MDTIKERFTSIDILRGLAVVLMVEQHLGIWLWEHAGTAEMLEYPFLVLFNALGGYAAPAFITLSGIGAVFLAGRHPSPVKAAIVRGLTIIAFGYLLNLMAFRWFSPGSWYVLHMIGFGLIVSPLLRKIPVPGRFGLFFLILASSVILQNYLDTPSYLSNSRMRNTSLEGGVFRLIIAEGQFPILPWLAMFISGTIAGRWFLEGRKRKIGIMGAVFLLSGVVLAFIGESGILKEYTSVKRVFSVSLTFYPANPPIILMLNGIVLLTVEWIEGLRIVVPDFFRKSNMLNFLGRVSLTILIFHVVFFREICRSLGLWRNLPAWAALGIMTCFIIATALFAASWSRRDYKYGLEWLLRKISR